MDAPGQIAQAARALAPDSLSTVGSYAQDLTVTAATATAATSTNVPAHGGFFSVSVGVAFNIRFGGAAVADPADTAAFPAGLYQFYLSGAQTKFKITANATGKACYWRSSAG
jgi:hypothetical protein